MMSRPGLRQKSRVDRFLCPVSYTHLDVYKRQADRRNRKGSGIGELTAKIEAADETEKLPKRGALSSYAPCELEFGVPVQQQLSPNGRSIGRRK